MADVGLLLDSTTTLPSGLGAEHGITMIPVPIYAGGREYRDGIDIDEEGFLRLLEGSKDRPSTAVPGPGEFVSWYRQVLRDHLCVVYPIASRRLSGLFNAAVQAGLSVPGAAVVAIDPAEGEVDGVVAVHTDAADLKRELARVAALPPPVVVVQNTDSVAGGVGLIVMRACEAIASGAALDKVLAEMIASKRTLQLHFVLPTLDYVVDRVGHLRAFFGTVLDIKPVMALENGLVEDVARVRGWAKAKRKMLELAAQSVHGRQVDLSILHSLAPDEAQQLLEDARASFNVRRSWLTGIGCTVSRYTGRGGLGIATSEV
ncbi:MAG: DegV domain-containing protein [Chloroflexi bacterium ADurb.Bin180]|nr:MAG: DegV domain-containing protein [Chloroflexi bacterium ADurb.Bin180]